MSNWSFRTYSLFVRLACLLLCAQIKSKVLISILIWIKCALPYRPHLWLNAATLTNKSIFWNFIEMKLKCHCSRFITIELIWLYLLYVFVYTTHTHTHKSPIYVMHTSCHWPLCYCLMKVGAQQIHNLCITCITSHHIFVLVWETTRLNPIVEKI